LIGLTSGLDTFNFAENRVSLSLDDLDMLTMSFRVVLASFWGAIAKEMSLL
jgi:hypothetical protein